MAWSGVDDGVPERTVQKPDTFNGGTFSSKCMDVDRRLQDIGRWFGRADYDSYVPEWVASYPCCDGRAVGSCCEVVATTHRNHFSPEMMVFAMRCCRWGSPDQVQVLWKDEGMDRYELISVFDPAWDAAVTKVAERVSVKPVLSSDARRPELPM